MRLVAAGIASLIALGWPVAGHAADAGYCAVYAKRLAQLLIPFVIRRAEETCGNAEVDQPPVPTDWVAALHLVDPDATPIMPLDRVDVEQIGIVPATEKGHASPTPPPPLKSPPANAVASAAATASKTSGAVAVPSVICARAHKKIAWSGKSWHCV